MKPGVFITVDVECSMGGAWADPDLRPIPPSRAVWGEFGDKKLGLPLVAEILDEHGLKATFFVEAFLAEQGYPGEAETVCKYLVDHGQDVQLHIHPNHKHYGLRRSGLAYRFTDDMADLEPEAQRVLLTEGRDRIAKWIGRAPVAFRAGNMAASEETLAQLAAVGIGIDSSYAFPYLGGQCRFAAPDRYNGSRWYGEVLEVTLSGFYQVRLPGLQPAKPLDLMGVSFDECRQAICEINRAGADAVVILHSFSLFKVRNAQYDGGRPNWIVTRRFRRLCEWLPAERETIPAYTFSDLNKAISENRYVAKAVSPCRLSLGSSLIRTAVQVLNRPYWV